MLPCCGQRIRQSRMSGRPPSGVAWWGHWLSKAKYSPATLAMATARPSTSTVVVSPGPIQSVGSASMKGRLVPRRSDGLGSGSVLADAEGLRQRPTHDQGLILGRHAGD